MFHHEASMYECSEGTRSQGAEIRLWKDNSHWEMDEEKNVFLKHTNAQNFKLSNGRININKYRSKKQNYSDLALYYWRMYIFRYLLTKQISIILSIFKIPTWVKYP